ncbi:MAG: helix-turn-helix transcriptional regulator [Salinivirgaceae bacterium]|nr:helix-turn-helix transcriptional regulator [Salinivirgaceae bacterium]
MDRPNEIHIGKIIENIMREQGRTNKWLAERICVCPPAISKIYKKKSIDANQILLISQALNVDLFQYYSALLQQPNISK